MNVLVPATGQLELFIPFAEWEGKYDRLEISRSRLVDTGPYDKIAYGTNWSGAFFYVSPKARFDVDGKNLQMLINGRVADRVEFHGTSIQDVFDAFAANDPGFLDVEPSTLGLEQDGFTVSTKYLGLPSSIWFVGGDAAPALGLDPKLFSAGTDPAKQLRPGKTKYEFQDPWGKRTDYYRVSLVDSRNLRASQEYPPFSGAVRGGASLSQLILGTIELFDITGGPSADVQVTLSMSQRVQPVPGAYPGSATITTDAFGRASVPLVRGLQLTLSISGTNLAREIVVPAVGDSFDLLDPSISVDNDAYKVQIPNIVVGERRTL